MPSKEPPLMSWDIWVESVAAFVVDESRRQAEQEQSQKEAS